MLGFNMEIAKYELRIIILDNLGSNSLLVGKLIGQGSSRVELVGAARTRGVSSDQIQEVKVSFELIFEQIISF